MEQVRIDFLVTASMGSLHKQVQTLNAELMQTASTVNLLDKNLNKLDVMSANRQFGAMVTSSGMFDHQMVSLDAHTKKFADSLSRARLTGRQYWQETTGYIRGQRTELSALAKQQVRMQNSIATPIGRGPGGAMTAGVTTPLGLASDMGTKLRVASKEWEIFNTVAQQGATHMVNWGKNTQWAGRQLMVGFTVPLMIAGGLAAKAFMDIDKQLVRLTKVYGSGFTFGDAYIKQTEEVRKAGMKMAEDMAKSYGQMGDETVGLMADLAAVGYQGEDLARMTEQTTRLSVLGEVDKQESMKATVALQTTFKMSTDQVAESVNFLNAVENQTSASLGDLIEAIPRAGTVVEGLGGSVQDLALYMTAFREGGISAAEGANALKSGLSSIIAPPKAAIEFMKEFGINLPGIVQKNAGDLTGTIMAFQKSLQGLDDLARQQVITKLFGKYQFARMNAFFNNLGAKGSQTLKVMDLMKTDTVTLSKVADQEIATIQESASGRWNKAWAQFKVTVAEVGQSILGWGTTALNILNKVFGVIGDNQWLLEIVKYGGAALAVIGPIVMLMGLFGNMAGMITKGVLRLINAFKVAGSDGGIKKRFEMMTTESFAAEAGLDKLTESAYDQTKAMEVLAQASKEYAMTLKEIAANSAMIGPGPVRSIPLSPQILNSRPNAGSQGFALSTEWDNTKVTKTNSISAARLAALPNAKLAGLGSSMTISERLRSGALSLTYEKAALSASKFGEIVGKAKKGEIDAQRKLSAIYAENEVALRGIYDEEMLLLQSDRDRYVVEKKIQELRLQSLPGMKSKSGNLSHYVTGAGIYSAELGGYNNGMMRPQSVFSNRTVDFFNKGDNAQAQEHLTLATASLEENMRLLSYAEQKYGISLADLKEATIRNALGLDMSAESQAQMAGIMQSFSDATLGITMVYEQEASRVMDSISQKIASDEALAAAQIKFTESLSVSSKLTESWAQKLLQEGEDLDSNNIIFQEMEMAGKKYIIAINNAAASAEKTLLGVTGVNASGGRTGQATADAKRAAEIFAKTTYEGAQRAAAISIDAAETAAKIEVNGATKETAIEVEGAVVEENIEMSGGGSSSGGGILGKFRNSSKLANGVGGAAMMLPMAATMIAPEGSVAGGISQGAMMGSMVGMIGGPWGMAAGAAGGAILAGIGEVMHHASEVSAQRAAEAAAAWESEFGQIDIGIELQKQLKINLDSFKMPSVDLSGFGQATKTATQEYSDAVSAGMQDQINTIKDMSDADAMSYGQRMFTNMVAGGADALDAMKLIKELMAQSGKGVVGFQIAASVSVDLKEKDAERQVVDSLSAIGAKAAAELNKTLSTGIQTEDTLATAGEQAGQAYYNGLKEAFDTGAISPEKYFTQTIKGSEKIQYSMTNELDLEGLLSQAKKVPGVMQDMKKQFGLTAKSASGLVSQFSKLSDLDKSEFYKMFARGNFGEGTQSVNQLGAAIYSTGAAQAKYLAEVRASNPEIAGLADRYSELSGVENIEEATLMALRTAREEYNQSLRDTAMLKAFTASVSKYADPGMIEEKINLNKLQRQQSREIEALQQSESDKQDALQKAEDDRLQAMQDAADKRERLMSKEINQVTRGYDKQIAQIQRIEDKRQEEFQKQQDLAQRRQEMRDMEISYDEAVASGDLFEAARIRMDIAATKKQHDAEDKQQASQDRADKKVKNLEKQKNQELRVMNKALRVEQRMNEKSIEAAQEASQAKIEAAQEASDARIASEEAANRRELKDAKQTNAEIAKDNQSTNDKISRMWAALQNGNLELFEKIGNRLGISSQKQAKIINDTWEASTGKLPHRIFDAVTGAIKSDNWKLIDNLMNLAVKGASPKEMNALLSWQNRYDEGGSPGANADRRAHGGYISGPGTATSDSINARLSNGEYVIRQAAVAKHGKSFFDKINNGPPGSFKNSGGTGAYAEGGMVMPIVGSIIRPIKKDITKIMSEALGSGPPGSGGGGYLPTHGTGMSDPRRARMVNFVRAQLGEPYVFGAAGPDQWDCSGLTEMAAATIGITLPHAASLQYLMSKKISENMAEAGDLAFFNPGTSGAPAGLPGHVGMMVGRKGFIQAANPSLGVIGSNLSTTTNSFVGIGRLPGLRSGGRINYDNTIANLHKGETVLTAPLTNKFEDNIAAGGKSEYNFNVNINEIKSEVDLERAFMRFTQAYESSKDRRMGRNRRIS